LHHQVRDWDHMYELRFLSRSEINVLKIHSRKDTCVCLSCRAGRTTSRNHMEKSGTTTAKAPTAQIVLPSGHACLINAAVVRRAAGCRAEVGRSPPAADCCSARRSRGCRRIWGDPKSGRWRCGWVAFEASCLSSLAAGNPAALERMPCGHILREAWPRADDGFPHQANVRSECWVPT